MLDVLKDIEDMIDKMKVNGLSSEKLSDRKIYFDVESKTITVSGSSETVTLPELYNYLKDQWRMTDEDMAAIRDGGFV